jgi:hypothetical protein
VIFFLIFFVAWKAGMIKEDLWSRLIGHAEQSERVRETKNVMCVAKLGSQKASFFVCHRVCAILFLDTTLLHMFSGFQHYDVQQLSLGLE